MKHLSHESDKNPFLQNCLVNPEAGSREELCKSKKDGATVQLYRDEVRADAQMLGSVTVTQTTWRGGGGVVAAEATQAMIRNTGGKRLLGMKQTEGWNEATHREGKMLKFTLLSEAWLECLICGGFQFNYLKTVLINNCRNAV